MLHWTAIVGRVPIDSINAKKVSKFQQGLLAMKISPATVNGYIRPIMAMLRCAADDENALLNRVPTVRILKVPKRIPLAFTTDEFRKVLIRVSAVAKRTCDEIEPWPWWKSLLLTD